MARRNDMLEAITSSCVGLALVIVAEGERSSTLRRKSNTLLVALLDFIGDNTDDTPEVTSRKEG